VTGPEASPGPSPSGPIRVLTADDQRVVREGLALLLGLLPGIEVVGTAADGEQALAMVAELQPDVVLMDLRMPRVNGVEATRRLRESHPQVKVVVLTTYADDRSVIDALQAGALGYLTKDASAPEIAQALQRVTSGQAALDPAVQRLLVEAIAGLPAEPGGDSAASGGAGADGAAADGAGADGAGAGAAGADGAGAGAAGAAGGSLPDGLTPREAEVLTLIAAGLSNGEIADRLVVSEATVKSHVNHLLPKIGARDRAQAVSYAYRHGLTS
jgi:DNA-binding NarL/FixJ family response regulator